MDTQTALGQPTKPRANANHARMFRRFSERPPLDPALNLARRAMFVFYPWTVVQYPGIERGLRTLLSGASTCWSTIENWRLGRRPLPPVAAEALIAALRERVTESQSLIAELELYAAARRVELARPRALMRWRAAGCPPRKK